MALIIPKLLLILVPFIFLAQPQNISQRNFVITKIPLRQSVFGSKTKHVTNDHPESSNNNEPNVVKQDNIEMPSIVFEKIAKNLLNVDVTLNNELRAKKHNLTIIRPEHIKEAPSLVTVKTKEDRPDITVLTATDKGDQLVETRDSPSRANNPTVYSENNKKATNAAGSTDTQESVITDIEKVKEKFIAQIVTEVTTPLINLITESKNYLIPTIASNIPPNLPSQEANSNVQAKPTLPREKYVTTQIPTRHLIDRLPYATITKTPKNATEMKPITRPFVQRKPTKLYSVNRLLNYICKKINGYYSNSNRCDEYVECKDNKAYGNICPDGLYFNSAAIWPEFPCTYPSEIECQSQPITQSQDFTDECPRSYGVFPVPQGDCGQFIMCQAGLPITMSCPPGLAFNSITSNCDWPVNVPGCNPNIFQDFTCPTVPVDTFDKRSHLVYYRYKESCKKYIACQERRPRLLSCDAGLSFNENKQKCENSKLITNCIS